LRQIKARAAATADASSHGIDRSAGDAVMAAASGYSSIMVHLDLGISAENRVTLAAGIAGRFDAHLIGVAAAEPWLPISGDPGMGMDATIIETYRRTVEGDIAAAEALFRRAVGAANDVEWRAGEASPAAHLMQHARAADLVVVGRASDADSRWHLHVAPGDVVMGIGRPLLVAPPGAQRLKAERVVVGWKDTAPSRRAIWDSLPFLKSAQEVFVVAVGDACEEGPQDVVAYLRRHAVRATLVLRPGAIVEPAEELLRTAEHEGADLLVVGAYGHERMREWILGGVTRDLLDDASICCLLSH